MNFANVRFRHAASVLLLTSLLATACSPAQSPPAQRPPNVIVVLTDDQGSGDLACHGNPWINTPNIDRFYKEAVRFTDYHVSPLCTPTRAALMTGRYPINNGAWATYKGRDALSEGATTIAGIFRDNGYRTGLFGKWHLGDNYPSRATDAGFEMAIHHKAGGVGELSDYWGNSYFDDTYYVNNQPREFSGYCTDVWFDEAMRYIDANREEPFFVYLATNAPHDPWIVADEYAQPYRPLEGEQLYSADFYGMIGNIDENFGKLRSFLRERDLVDNTILIFMTDNGSSGGISPDGETGFNHGLRGRKGDKTEGGHRVPFFIRWPGGEIQGGRDVDALTTHVDFLPTLASLCGIEVPEKLPLDGLDVSSLLTEKSANLPNRTVFVHNRQDWRPPSDLRQTCLMSDKWRLVNGKELYDIENDRRQLIDLSDSHPDIVRRMIDENAAFVQAAKLLDTYNELPCTVVGNEAQPEVKLTIQHAIGEDKGIWKVEQVAAGMKNANNTHALAVERAGWYSISCQRWPKERPGPVLGVPANEPGDELDYRSINPDKVRISIANQILEQEIEVDQEAVVFRVWLDPGKTLLVNDFLEQGQRYGVYYTYIRFLGEV